MRCCNDKITFIFAIFVIQHNHKLAFAVRAHDVGHLVKHVVVDRQAPGSSSVGRRSDKPRRR